MDKFYDGTKLLSLMDINGEKPEIYICTSNRSAGKTTFFNRYTINRFKKFNEKFMILFRHNYEITTGADKFFKDINNLFFQDDFMTCEKRDFGKYYELFLNNIPCGYCAAINDAEEIKKCSHLFSDVSRIIFDEFQSETNRYLVNEVDKFMSIHQSIARGGNEQSRYVQVIMISNPVTILNPYYAMMNISSRLNSHVNFLKGDGFVLEQSYNESAALAQKQSAFNRAFAQSNYLNYSIDGQYLNDNYSFIEKPEGKSQYLITIKCNGKDYGLYTYSHLGYVYVSDKSDSSFKFKLSVTTEDHQINYIMLSQYADLIKKLRYYFEHGCFRFKNLECKDAILKALSYY